MENSYLDIPRVLIIQERLLMHQTSVLMFITMILVICGWAGNMLLARKDTKGFIPYFPLRNGS